MGKFLHLGNIYNLYVVIYFLILWGIEDALSLISGSKTQCTSCVILFTKIRALGNGSIGCHILKIYSKIRNFNLKTAIFMPI